MGQFLLRVFYLLLLLSGVGSMSMGQVGGQVDNVLYLPGQLILKIDPAYRSYLQGDDISVPGLTERIAALPQAQVQRAFPRIAPPADLKQPGPTPADLSLIFYVSFDRSYPVWDAIRVFAKHPAIDYVEPWYGHQSFYQPNDPYSDTTGGANGMWHLQQIRAREAWDLQRNDSTVLVGITDSGTGDHPDLQDNWGYNHDDPIDGIDNDNDGYVDNYFGWDFGGDTTGSLGDNDPRIGNVHGTWVTGIVGATADNGIGLPGICFNCKYLPIKAAPNDNIGAIYYGYQSIVYAVQQGAQVVNCSWGSSLRSRFGEDVIQFATVNRQAAVVVACGNSQSDFAYYPAAYERAISVANSSYGDTLFVNSTYHYSVDVAAPGWNIRSTLGNNGYHTWGGTSASAPVVAGAVALVKSYFPDLTGYEAAQRLRVTADDITSENPDKTDKLGQGRINLLRALIAPPSPSIRQIDYTLQDLDGDQASRPGDTLDLRLVVQNHLSDAGDLSLRFTIPAESVPAMSLLDRDYQVGPLAQRQTHAMSRGVRIVLDENIGYNERLALRVDYSDPITGYSDFEYLYLTVNRSYLNLSVNRIHTTVNSQGNFGWDDFLFQQEGQGLRYQGQTNVLFEGGFLVGANVDQVSDQLRNPTFRDEDFAIVEPILREVETNVAPFEAHGIFSDASANDPLGLTISHDTYAFDRSDWQNFVLLRYVLRNDGTTPLTNLYAGLFADWDVSPQLIAGGSTVFRDACSYDTAEKIAFAYDLGGGNGTYYGMTLLSDQDFHSFARGGVDVGFAFNDSSKYQALRNVPTPATATRGIDTNGDDIMQFLSGGPIDLAPGETDTLLFALLAEASYSELTLQRDEAARAYRCEVLGKGPKAPFALSDTLVNVGDVVQVADQNAQAISWYWEFGDGAVSTDAAPQHTFAQPGRYDISLTVTDGDCDATLTRTVEVRTTTHLPSSLANNWQLSPNPTQGELAISGPWPQNSLDITAINASGQAIYHEKVMGQLNMTYRLDTHSWLPGIYQLLVQGQDFQRTFRVIVRRN